MEIIDKIVSSTSPVNKRGVMWLNPASGILQYPSANGWSPIGANSLGGGSGETTLKLAKTIEDGVLKCVMRSPDNSVDFSEMDLIVPKPGYIYTMPTVLMGLGEFLLDDFYSIVFNIESIEVHSISNPDAEVPEDAISSFKDYYNEILPQFGLGCTCLPLEEGKVCILSQQVTYGPLRKDAAEYFKKELSFNGEDFLSELNGILADKIPSKGELANMYLKGVGDQSEYNVDIVLKCEDIHPVKEAMLLMFMLIDMTSVNWVENDDPYFKYKGYFMGEEMLATNNSGKITIYMSNMSEDAYIETEIFSIEDLKKHLTNVGDGTFCILETEQSNVTPMSTFLNIWSPQPENIDDFQKLQTITRTDDLLIFNTNYVQFQDFDKLMN